MLAFAITKVKAFGATMNQLSSRPSLLDELKGIQAGTPNESPNESSCIIALIESLESAGFSVAMNTEQDEPYVVNPDKTISVGEANAKRALMAIACAASVATGSSAWDVLKKVGGDRFVSQSELERYQ